MKFKNKLKRGAVLALALILALLSTTVVYAAVSYDSSKDPVVAYSGMVSYVESVLSDIRNTLASFEARLALLEINGPVGGGTSASSAQVAEIMKEIDSLKKTITDLQKENNTLKTDLIHLIKNYKYFIMFFGRKAASLGTKFKHTSVINSDSKVIESELTENTRGR